MSRITLELANGIIAAAFTEGARLDLKPLSVAIVDAGGHLIAFQRSDGASFGRAQIAIGKAAGALALGVSSRILGEMAQQRPWFISAFAASAPHPIIPAAGAVIIVDDHGSVIGAAGVTGDTADNDELAVIAGVEATGLVIQIR